MRVINKSNGNVIADRVIIADNILTRIIGLLNRTNLEEGEGLLIIPCNNIHSCGMRFKFDAVFLDKDNKVQHLIKNMKPWRISPIIKSAYSTLELPAGTLEKFDIKNNDLLVFE